MNGSDITFEIPHTFDELASVAQFERTIIRERQSDGIQAAKLKGRMDMGITFLKCDVGIDVVESVPGTLSIPLGQTAEERAMTMHPFTGVEITDTVPPEARGKWVARIEPSHFEAGSAYVVFTGYREGDDTPYVYRLSQFGKEWTRLGASLATNNPATIRPDPVDRWR